MARSYSRSPRLRSCCRTGSRPTGGTCSESEQVDGGVRVPVDDQAARLAAKDPLFERQAWLSPSAPRARLAGGIPAVSHDQPTAIPCRLVIEHPPGGTETLVGHRPSQVPTGQHARDVQVLGHDRLVAGGEARSGLVQSIGPAARYPGVYASEAGSCFAPVRRALRLAGMGPAGTPQSAQRGPEGLRSWHGDQLPAITNACQQCLDSEVDADHRPRANMASWYLPLGLDLESHEPTPGGGRDGCRKDAGGTRLQPPGELARGLVGADGAQPRKSNGGIRAPHGPCREPERVPTPATPLGLREPEPPSFALPILRANVVVQRAIQVAECLLVDALGVLTPPDQPRVGLLRHIP
jgi:hypothetical protein